MTLGMPDTNNDIPDPHAAFSLWRIGFEALLAEMGPKKAARIVRRMAEQLSDEESLAEVFVLRSSPERDAARKALREASALFKRYAPIFLARVGGGK